MEQASLGPDIQSVTVTTNPACPQKQYPLLVTYGSTSIESNDCEDQKNVTSNSLSPGESAIFSTEATSVALDAGERYLYTVSFNGIPSELHKH